MTMRDATIAEAAPDPGMNPALADGPTIGGGQSAGGGAEDTTASGLALETQLQRLTPISLDEINAQARLMTRVDRKYFLPRGLFIDLLAATRDDFRVLEIDGKHRFEYRTAYFDTPDFRFYRDHVQERRHRFKVRTRTYVDTGTCHLEVKSKGYRGQTVKERIAHPLDSPLTLTDGDREFIDSVLGGPPARAGGVDSRRPALPATGFRGTRLRRPWVRRSRLRLQSQHPCSAAGGGPRTRRRDRLRPHHPLSRRPAADLRSRHPRDQRR
jgi:hypothetical protein